MKRILTVLAFLATMMSASLMAADAKNFVYFSGGQVDVFNETTSLAKIGIGSEKVLDSNFMFGYKFAATYASMAQEDMNVVVVNEDANMVGIEFDVNIGYNIASKVSIYSSVSFLAHSIGDSESGSGFGFGGGVSYQPFNNLAIATEYKSYDMGTTDSQLSIDYDYDVMEVQLRYVF